MTALATCPDLEKNVWTPYVDPRYDVMPPGHPAWVPVLPTTKELWMKSASSYHPIQRLPDGRWLAGLNTTGWDSAAAGGGSLADPRYGYRMGFVTSKDGYQWDNFPDNPILTGRAARQGVRGQGLILAEPQHQGLGPVPAEPVAQCSGSIQKDFDSTWLYLTPMLEKEIPINNEWKRLEFGFTTPGLDQPEAVAGMRDLYIRIDCRDSSGTVWIEDLSLREAETVDEWTAWQDLGLDRNSTVADPLFVDAVKDDYRLRPESPALKLGFEPIPVERIGCYADPLRASWPVR
jgi:hypothetical protein